MKTMITRFYVLIALTVLALMGRVATAVAQDRNMQMDRLECLEKRVNEMAERQEQFMRRLGAQMERQAGPQAGPRAERQRPAGRLEIGKMRQQFSPTGAPGVPGAPQNVPAAKAAKGLHDLFGLLFVIGVICNILLAIWIFTDIRKRGEGSGIFIAMALVAGIPAALIYALTRLGDKKA